MTFGQFVTGLALIAMLVIVSAAIGAWKQRRESDALIEKAYLDAAMVQHAQEIYPVDEA